jgi:hypothetical protein
LASIVPEAHRRPHKSTAQSEMGSRQGSLPPARLHSWLDLAAQLDVSRGTVRVVYERLIDEQFAIGLGAAGTRVAERPLLPAAPGWSPEAILYNSCHLWSLIDGLKRRIFLVRFETTLIAHWV